MDVGITHTWEVEQDIEFTEEEWALIKEDPNNLSKWTEEMVNRLELAEPNAALMDLTVETVYDDEGDEVYTDLDWD